ncbi:hypothetical protein SRABI03_00439 [Microbacterium foliorum]|nr:hypothetical protein SRABI03_00439 [Microbacterium foliorum]
MRVQPGRNGRPSRYRCTTLTCDWEANSKDDGLWASVHDAGWLTLADAARLVQRTPGTVRNWVTQKLLEPQVGRYWQDDVVTVATRKRGETA